MKIKVCRIAKKHIRLTFKKSSVYLNDRLTIFCFGVFWINLLLVAILFPTTYISFLETLPQNYVRYEKKDWIEEYKKEIKHNKDLSVLDKIFIVDSGYKEERIFKLIKGR